MADSVCVACGSHYNGSNHHCSPKFESAKQAAQTKASNEETFLMYEPQRLSEAQRLSVGFRWMQVGRAE